MKRVSLLLTTMFLSACSPSADQVGKSAQVTLQKYLDTITTFQKDHLKVERIIAIHTAGPTFTATATISGHGREFQLPLDISADKDNVIFNTDGPRWSKLSDEISAARGNVFSQAYGDVVLRPEVFDEFMPELLKPDAAAFKKNLDVIVPVDTQGRYWFGEGCRAHECGSYEAAWAVDQKTGVGSAIIMNSDDQGNKSFQVYVDSGSLGDVPEPLIAWAQERSATPLNTVVMHSAYKTN